MIKVIALILVIPFFLLTASYFTNATQLCSDEFLESQPKGSLLSCSGYNVIEHRGFPHYYNENDGVVVGELFRAYIFWLIPSALVVSAVNFVTLRNKRKL